MKTEKELREARPGQKAAVAMKYNPDLNYAPVVVAAGLGHLAQKIVNIADENGVPVYRDDSAAALLVMLNSGEKVPPQLYSVVAAIYAEVVLTSGKIPLPEKPKPKKSEEKSQENPAQETVDKDN